MRLEFRVSGRGPLVSGFGSRKEKGAGLGDGDAEGSSGVRGPVEA